jgi:hypothetical protein
MPPVLGCLKLTRLLGFQTSQVPPDHLFFHEVCLQGTNVLVRLMCLSRPLTRLHLVSWTGLCEFVGVSQLPVWHNFWMGLGFWAQRMRLDSGSWCIPQWRPLGEAGIPYCRVGFSKCNNFFTHWFLSVLPDCVFWVFLFLLCYWKFSWFNPCYIIVIIKLLCGVAPQRGHYFPISGIIKG